MRLGMRAGWRAARANITGEYHGSQSARHGIRPGYVSYRETIPEV
jgi:hypothetical protein